MEEGGSKLASLCTNETYFAFKGRFYKVTSGVAMGETMEKEGVVPSVSIRYVDDVLAVVKKQDRHSVLASLNNIHRKITFTIETEVDRSLLFWMSKL